MAVVPDEKAEPAGPAGQGVKEVNWQAKSRRAAAGRAQLRALTLGGAVWDAFRENANCGDPPG